MVLYEVIGDRQVGKWRGEVIKISEIDDWEGVATEYQYIEEKFGKDWRRKR